MSSLLLERHGAVAVLCLNRPEVRNAVDVDLMTSLRDALDDLAIDDEIRAVVLTGQGKAFCAGLDLVELEATGANLELGAVTPTAPRTRRGPPFPSP